jgi:hypothetical protein
MLSEQQFKSWLLEHKVSAETAQIIQAVRSSPPSRKTQSRRSNVSGRYPSRKMAQTIQFESHKVELAFIREHEFDDDVLEYYDQPEPIKIFYLTANGRKVAALTTPDFFVIRKNGTAGWEECKQEQKLQSLAKKSDRFVQDENEVWQCPPGSVYSESL